MIIILLIIILFYLIYDLPYKIHEKFNNEINIDYNVIHLKNINNNNNINRHINIIENESKLKKKINLFDAIHGSNIDLNNLSLYDSRINLTFKYDYIGELGCYLSHMLLIKSFINSKNKYSVIFEDDLKILDDNLDNEIKKIIDKIDNNFDIIFLGNINNIHGDKIIDNIYSINNSDHLWGTHAYIVNNNNAQKIYDSLLNINNPIDIKLEYNINNNILNGYVIYPILVSQNPTKFSSDIKSIK
jgi:glycosyl transferase family 25